MAKLLSHFVNIAPQQINKLFLDSNNLIIWTHETCASLSYLHSFLLFNCLAMEIMTVWPVFTS